MTVENYVLNVLETVRDPLLDLNAIEMKLKMELESKGNSLNLHLTAGFPCNFLENSYKSLVQARLENAFPQYQIKIVLHQEIKAYRSQMVGKGLRGVKNTIAVASGKGGVGKSTVTVNLAAALARLGASVGVLDADIYGPSIPMMLGNAKPVEIKDDYYLPVKAHGLQAMSIGYLTDPNQALIWRGPMLAKSLIQMLDSTLWEDLDYLFIDLPPGTGDIQLTLVQKIPLTAAIVVTTPQNIATLDAQKAIALFSKTGIHCLGLIENMSTHLCSHCGQLDAIFGEGGASKLCAIHQTKLLGQLPLDSRIRQACDAGLPIAIQDGILQDPFNKAALHAAIELAKRPINYADKFPNIVVE